VGNVAANCVSILLDSSFMIVRRDRPASKVLVSKRRPTLRLGTAFSLNNNNNNNSRIFQRIGKHKIQGITGVKQH